MMHAMKKTLLLLSVLAPAACAAEWFDSLVDDTSAVAWNLYSDWHHKLPESGLFPSFFSFETVSNMGERHGGSTLSWQKLGLCVPLADPRKSGGKDWMFNASANAELTFMDADGEFDLRRNELYNFSLPVTAIIPRDNGNMMIFAIAPALATDFVHRAHSFHVNLLFSYSVQHSETFTYSVGIGHSPDATIMGFMPVFSFDWKMSPEWTMHLSGLNYSIMRNMGQGLELGAFVDGAGGSWAVSTPSGTRMLRVRSLVAGLKAAYDFSKPGETKRLAILCVGSTLITTADILRYNSDMDRVKGHHYHPGLYVSAAVDFRF